MSTREAAIQSIEKYFDDGRFLEDLGRRVAIPTESQNPERQESLRQYLEEEMSASLERLDFECKVYPNSVAGCGPRPIGPRLQDPLFPTLFPYRRADLIRRQ